MKTVGEISKISSVSVRTLRYYDKKGLLRPAEITESGYRLYDDESLKSLRTILIFKELGFTLEEIKTVMHSERNDIDALIKEQLKMLKAKRKRLDAVIELAEKICENGDDIMDFSAFDEKEETLYREEAKQKWGKTKAYGEYAEKAENRSEAEEGLISEGLMIIFREFGEMRDRNADCEEVKKQVVRLKAFISDNFYECTDEILSSLGQMYSGDERFRENIDRFSSPGTADFVSRAIETYVNEK